jgi:hypothetical protein
MTASLIVRFMTLLVFAYLIMGFWNVYGLTDPLTLFLMTFVSVTLIDILLYRLK